MNVTGVAFVPMTPLMFRHLSGAADPLAELREAAVQAIRDACEGAAQVVVLCPVGGREAPGDWRDPSHAGPVHGDPWSLSERVADHLVTDVARIDLPLALVPVTLGSDLYPDLASVASADESEVFEGAATAVIVLGDGAAARSQGAPGHIDERSFPFDDAVAAALEGGDGAGLAALAVAPEAVDLLVAGRHSWPQLGAWVPRAAEAELRWRGDPLGLTYLVALWRP